MEALPSDPDRFALGIVQQWLQEQGYTRALAALEQESGLRVHQEVQHGSQLLQLVYDHIEGLAAASLDDAEVARRQLEEALLTGGSSSSPGDCPCRLRCSLDGLHPANIIAIGCWPTARLAVTGSSDGWVRVLGYDGSLVQAVEAGSSGVLCLALQRGSSSNSSSSSGGGVGHPGMVSSRSGGPEASLRLVATGHMDGSVAVLDPASGAVLARASPHRKYVVAASWAPDGRHLVTASWDCTFAVHRLQRKQARGQHQGLAAASTAAAAAAGAGASHAAAEAAGEPGEANGSGGAVGGGGWELVTIYTEQTPAKVNAVEYLPPLDSIGSGKGSSGSSGSANGSAGSEGTFLVAVQGSNYLREISISANHDNSGGSGGESSSGSEHPAAAGSVAATAEGLGIAGAGDSSYGTAAGSYDTPTAPSSSVREARRINMNATGDDHVSFSASHLAVSPCGRLLLVSADNGRLVVYERAGWTQVRSIIGLPTEQFHQFAAAWHRSGHYIMAAAAHGGLCIFHVGTAKRVATLAAHAKNVRGLAYDAQNNLLLTCSFDRTVKIWEAGEAAAAAATAAP